MSACKSGSTEDENGALQHAQTHARAYARPHTQHASLPWRAQVQMGDVKHHDIVALPWAGVLRLSYLCISPLLFPPLSFLPPFAADTCCICAVLGSCAPSLTILQPTLTLSFVRSMIDSRLPPRARRVQGRQEAASCRERCTGRDCQRGVGAGRGSDLASLMLSQMPGCRRTRLVVSTVIGGSLTLRFGYLPYGLSLSPFACVCVLFCARLSLCRRDKNPLETPSTEVICRYVRRVSPVVTPRLQSSTFINTTFCTSDQN